MSISNQRRRAFLYADRDHCLTVNGSTVLSFSLQPPNAAYLTAWAGAMDRLASVATRSIAVVTVIDSNSRPPDESAKAAIKNAISRHQNRICAFAYVIEGQGFGAAAMRSALSLISLAARYPFPQKVFANTAASAAWIIKHMPADSPTATSAAGIASVIETMRHEVTCVAATG